jgi:L-alanine-DL-glutamate epimerase-like enolase superfamily enzyme
MKIAKVEAIPRQLSRAERLQCAAPPVPGQDHGRRRAGRLGRVHHAIPREANFAAKAIIEGMAPNLIGKDPVQTEALWRQNKQQAWWYGYHGGIASYATAAIDIALWDLKGKALGRSVLDLLGGLRA